MASLGTVLVMFPASLWMDRAGRKTGFITGTLSGIMAAVISMVAMIEDSFILLCTGMFFWEYTRPLRSFPFCCG